jgi:hypothetical protein
VDSTNTTVEQSIPQLYLTAVIEANQRADQHTVEASAATDVMPAPDAGNGATTEW